MRKTISYILIFMVMISLLASCTKPLPEKKISLKFNFAQGRGFETEILPEKMIIKIKSGEELISKNILSFKDDPNLETELKEGNYTIEVELLDRDGALLLSGKSTKKLVYGENEVKIDLIMNDGKIKFYNLVTVEGKTITEVKCRLVPIDPAQAKEITVTNLQEETVKPGIWEINATVKFNDDTTYEIKNNAVQVLPGKTSLFIIK